MTSTKKKAQAATWAINNRNKYLKQRNDSVNTIQSQTADNFDTRFKLSTGRARICVQPQNRTDGKPVVELTDDFGSNMLLSPAEALSVATALQAVATYLLEEPRQLRRRTEPGAPAFEEAL